MHKIWSSWFINFQVIFFYKSFAYLCSLFLFIIINGGSDNGFLTKCFCIPVRLIVCIK